MKTLPEEPRELNDVDMRLLTTAAKLFRERGFVGATIRDLAQAANMRPGSIHYRYATKQDLLLELLKRALHRAFHAVHQAIESTDDPHTKFRRALRAHVRLLCSGDDTVYVLMYEWRWLTGPARKELVRWRDTYDQLWDSILKEADDNGLLVPGIDIKLIRLLGLGALNWSAQWFNPNGERSPDELADALWAMLSHGVVNPSVRADNLVDLFAHHSAIKEAH